MSGTPRQAEPPESEAAPGMTPLKRAFIALENAQARVAALEAAAREPVAIIGMACRVPGGGDDPEAFWRLLRDGVDATSPLPGDRWDVQALYHPDPETPGRIAATRGAFLREVDKFDPAVFGITPREAQGMDPQQRLLLEVSWEALENAGTPPDRLERTSTGVYFGVCGSDYAYLQLQSGDCNLLDAHFASGMAHSIASGRLSYVLGLQGPSMTIDTACSSSLVAVHLASQALRVGECRMALAGGVNLILSPDIYIALSHSRMLAPDGRCKTFDAAADGFARGEGCGVIVLKRLSDARADGDRILAVIRGSAVNQDGPSSGLTAPNGPAQEAVIREALSRAGVAARDVGYIEAHGTGTQLGDPLEVTALAAVFGERGAQHPLWLGSVKTNVGHLEAAAGITGLIKVVLALRHRALPQHLHFKTPSPHIRWSDFPVRIPTELVPWQPISGRRIAGVSSFGFSGTNAHVVLEEAPPEPQPPATARDEGAQRSQYVFVLSAREETALSALSARYAAAFASADNDALADLCFSAAAARANHPYRAVVLARSMDELRERLAALSEGRSVEGLRTARVAKGDPPRIAFLFTGQGAQYVGMARALYESQPVFRAALDRCAAVLDGLLDHPLRSVLFPAASESSPIDQTSYTQPVLFAVEYALAELWRAWGVRPDIVMGHSVGEYVAACLAGVMSLEDSLRLVAERGRLMQLLPAGGAMAAVFADEQTVSRAIASHSGLCIAALNGPAQTVISGDDAAVRAACERLTSAGVRCERLSVSHAFHSSRVDPVLDAFQRAVERVKLSPPRLRLISNVTGRVAEARELTQPHYWRSQVREPVRFADGVRSIASLAPDVLLEIGPHATLLSFAQATLADLPDAPAPLLAASLRKGRADADQLAEALGSLYLRGVSLDWRAVWSATARRILDLPPYPFQRQRFWFRARAARTMTTSGGDAGHPLLGTLIRSAITDAVQFESTLDQESLPYLRDHRVQGRAILPAAAFLEMALAAGRVVLGASSEAHDVVIGKPLAVGDGDDDARIVQVVVRRTGPDEASFEILSCDPVHENASWDRHVQGQLRRLSALVTHEREESIRERCVQPVEAGQHYAQLAGRGLIFGPALQGVRRIHRRAGEAVGDIELPPSSVSGAGDFVIHPALLDACLQVISSAVSDPATSDAQSARVYLPLAIESVRVGRAPGSCVRSHVRLRESGAGTQGSLNADVTVFDERGTVAQLSGILLRSVSAARASQVLAQQVYEVAWERLVREDGTWMPLPAELSTRVGSTLPALLNEHDVGAYQHAFQDLETLSTVWIAQALSDLGWQPKNGALVLTEALAAQLGVAPRYQRLLGRFLAILAEEGILCVQGDGWVVAGSLPTGKPEHQLAEALRRHPSSRARLRLAGNCGPHLAGILRGTVDPLELLFPGGSTELAESLYRESPEAQAYNQLVRAVVLNVVNAMPRGHTLRILEVGGGTGGTTAWVAPALPADRTHYIFTDIGQFMVARAREKFSKFPFMDFQTLDLEQEAAGQGLADGGFDLILASNVIHATADLKATLLRLRRLLRPGGTLLMLEVAGLERWIDITFGLTDGWWRFTDTRLRADYPLLQRHQWLRLLIDTGFDAEAVGAADPRSREALFAARKLLDDAVDSPAASWLILCDSGGIGHGLAARLRAAGRHATLVAQTAGTRSVGDLCVDTSHEAQLRALLSRECRDVQGIVYLWGLDLSPASADAPPLADEQRKSLGSLLVLVQTLGTSSHISDTAPRLWIATRGAQSLDGRVPAQVVQAPLTGFGKVVALEHPELRPVRVDLDPETDCERQAQALFDCLSGATDEEEIAIRGGALWVPRLSRATLADGGGETLAVSLEKAAAGVLDEMQLLPTTFRVPGPGEVQIRVLAAGLNFRDVMNAVALREDPEPLGGECAGRIVSVGANVTGFSVGDHVVATAEGCFATFTTVDARHVALIPPGIGFAQAATLPFAFMTAHYALNKLGRLAAGETVLIHAGAGGVGMAAIQLAQRAGARILATAGTEEKRAFLRGLGVSHVFNSRTLDFAHAVLAHTGGKGVDVILNSLAGDFIGESVRCLAPEGRFLEIGKRDIWDAARFRSQRPHGEYHPIDLAAQRCGDAEASFALLAEVMGKVARREIGPLPAHLFPLERAGEAFRFMAQARHIGKIVLLQHDSTQTALDCLTPRATYLVTGGLTGLGLLTAARLVERGARHVALLGRRAADDAATAAIEAMRARGVTVTVLQADVSDRKDLERALATLELDQRPLRGIIHSAGTLADGALIQQTWARFAEPLKPKMDGSWALHELTRECRLDFFVLYSSMASMLGSPGQANHAAANAFMDSLAHHRRALGLPGLSISWGAWSEIGAAAERNVGPRILEQGIEPITPTQGLELLEALMCSPAPHAGVFPVQWQRFLAHGRRRSRPFFARMRDLADAGGAAPLSGAAEESHSLPLAARLQSAGAQRRQEILLQFVSENVARVIGGAGGHSIDPRQPLNEIGLDSLMAVELRNRLSAGLGVARRLPATLVFDYPTLLALAQFLERDFVPTAGTSTIGPTAEPAAAASGSTPAQGAEPLSKAIDELSDEEIERLYAQKLGRS